MHIILKKYNEFPTIKCLDHGYVKLIDCMPGILPDGEETADYAIAEAARCSYQRGTKSISDDKALIRYLLRNDHTSPFEMIDFKFHLKMPMFVARQWVRHRTASLNELSGRYSEMPNEYYCPPDEELRTQSKVNKQGSDDQTVHNKEIVSSILKSACKQSFDSYGKLLGNSLVRELSRVVLPLSTYTEMYWKIDLKNLLHLLDLRCDHHAQKEIRVFADAILELITPIVPYTIEAWNEYSQYRNGLKLSEAELKAIATALKDIPAESINLDTSSKSEQAEWQIKLAKILNKS